MPLSYIAALYQIAEQRVKTDEGKRQKASEDFEDDLEASAGI
jgi:hypothetical protein